MKYKIDWMERMTTSTGKNKINAQLVDEKGVKLEDVTLWESSWTNFKELGPGMEVNGDYKEEQRGKYLNKTLFQAKTWSGNGQISTGQGNSPQTANKSYGGAYKGSRAMLNTMNVKNENIKEAQERKEEAIKKAACQRDAVLVVTTMAEYEHFPEVVMEQKIKEWIQKFTDLQNLPF